MRSYLLRSSSSFRRVFIVVSAFWLFIAGTVIVVESSLPIMTNSIANGDYHTTAIRTNGIVVATGRNDEGQLNVSGWRNVVALACGSTHTIGLKNDGTVLVTGVNSKSASIITSWRNVVAVAGGGSHTVSLKSDGTIVASCNNSEGLCNVTSAAMNWVDIIAVSVGHSHIVGLKSNGTVVAVGDNADGQLNVGEWRGIVAISAGGHHTLGLKSDGTVVSAGLNDNGQTNVTGWRDIVSISGGHFHSIGLKSDGTAVATGLNKEGQTNVSSWRDMVAVAGGGWHSTGLKNNGTLVAIGFNDDYQLNVSGWLGITTNFRASGIVKDQKGSGIAGFQVAAGSVMTTTDQSGRFTLSGLTGSLSIKASKEGYSVNPSYREVSKNAVNVDFVATYAVTGRVVDALGNGMKDVMFVVDGATYSTDYSGNFTISGLSGPITLAPKNLEGYSFTPNQVSAVGPMKDVRFSGGFEASGKVVDLDGKGLAGFLITAGGNTTLTDKDGAYSFSGLSKTISIYASKEGYVTNPSNEVVSYTKKNIDFRASYRLKGKVTDTKGNGIGGVEIRFAGVQGVTDYDGFFVLSGLSGKGEVFFYKEGFSFEPPTIPVSEPAREYQVIGKAVASHVALLIDSTHKLERVTEDGVPKKSPKGGFEQYPIGDYTGQKMIVQLNLEGKDFVFTTRKDGSGQRIIAEGFQPHWQPGGELIAFLQNIQGHSHVIVSDDKGDTKQLTKGDHDERFLTWSPDGKWLAFISDLDGSHQLYIIRADGTGMTQLTVGDAEVYYSSWESDGWLYFVSNFGYSEKKRPLQWDQSDMWRIKPLLP